jgi:hypothetical protein
LLNSHGFRKTIESEKDLLAVAGEMIEAAEAEIAYLAPILGFTSQYGFLRAGAKKLIQNGGRVRGATTLSFYYIDAVRELLDIGEDVRHVGNSQEVLTPVRDQKESISSINVFKNDPLFEDRLVAFWSDDPPMRTIYFPPLRRSGQSQLQQQSGSMSCGKASEDVTPAVHGLRENAQSLPSI